MPEFFRGIQSSNIIFKHKVSKNPVNRLLFIIPLICIMLS